MKDIPLPITVNCLNPQRIFNSYSNQWLTVSCGNCKACRLNKNSRLAFQCDLEAKSHEYVVFVTLTYSDKYIPKFRFESSIEDPLTNNMVDCSTGEILETIEISEANKELLINKCHLNGCIPYLRKTDLQSFMKRFRYYASKYYKGKIRYFSCGEIGPVHFRPHFHLLLYFSDKSLLQVCEECVLQAWTFGRIDCQLSQGKTSSYVASYVNSSCNLPRVLSFQPSVRSRYILSAWVNQFCKIKEREFIHKPLVSLFREALISMAKIENLGYGGRVTLIFTPNVKDMLINLHLNYMRLIQSIEQQKKSSAQKSARNWL